MNQDIMDRQVTHLLHKVAEDVSSNVNLLPRVHQQLASAPMGSGHGERAFVQLQALPRWGYLAISMVLVVGLLSAFAFARPLIFSWLGDNGLRGMSLHNAPQITGSTTEQGITLQLEQAYADAARTAVTMRIHVPSGHSMVSPRADMTYLVDSQGRRYAVLAATQVDGEGLLEFIPLGSDALRSEQTLTLVVQGMIPTGTGSPITGPWHISFQLRPQAARSITFAATPMTRDGVTMQPERLDLTPAGARLLVRMSGLAADTSLFGLTRFVQHGADSVVGCPPGSSTCVTSSSTSEGALLRLQGPSQQVLEPSSVAVVGPGTSDVGAIPTASQTVGPSGSVLIEVLFFTPLHATSGTARLTIDQLALRSTQVNASGQEQVVTGPWTFEFALP